MPGGRPEPGESLADAVRREVREETGLEVEVMRELEVVRLTGEGFTYEIHEYLCRLATEGRGAPPAPPTAGDDAAAAVWADLADLASFALTPAVLGVIGRGLAKLTGA